MNDNWQLAGIDLASVLGEENAALAALDLPRAVALLERKVARVAKFEGLRAVGVPHAEAVELLEQLAALAAENRRLLDRAIKAQGRLIGVIAGVVRAAPMAPRYGARGRLRPERAPLSLTLSAAV